MLAVTRAAAIPLAIVVVGLMALTQPLSVVRPTLLALGVGAAGWALLAAASWWQASSNAGVGAAARNASQIAAEDAADDDRMNSDAG
jgi:hypothetical protein